MTSETTTSNVNDFKEWLSQELCNERHAILATLTDHLQNQHEGLVAKLAAKLKAEVQLSQERLIAEAQPGISPTSPRDLCAAAANGPTKEHQEQLEQQRPTNKHQEQLEQQRPSDPSINNGACKVIGPPAQENHQNEPNLGQQEPTDLAENHAIAQAQAKEDTVCVQPLAHSSRGPKEHGDMYLMMTYLRKMCNSKPSCSWIFRTDAPPFELLFGSVIVANTVLVALDMQYNGEEIGYTLGVNEPARESYPNLQTRLEIANWVCNILFTLELVLRLHSGKCKALKCPWICVDLFVVPISWLETVKLVQVNTSIIRILRLARTIRVVKLIRSMSTFRVLFFLIRSLMASIEALFWSFAVIAALQIFSGLFMGQMLAGFIEDESQNLIDRTEIFYRFGTFARVMLTMFEISDANWIVPARELVDKVNPWWGLYLIVYRCMVFFAFGKVIAAVFISETNRLVEDDRELQLIKKQAAAKEYMRSIWDMFDAMDVDGDRQISRDELAAVSDRPEILALAQHMDLDTSHLEDMFNLLEGPDGCIHIDQFVKGLPKLKGSASSLEMTAISVKLDNVMKCVHRMQEESSELFKSLHTEAEAHFSQWQKSSEQVSNDHIRPYSVINECEGRHETNMYTCEFAASEDPLERPYGSFHL